MWDPNEDVAVWPFDATPAAAPFQTGPIIESVTICFGIYKAEIGSEDYLATHFYSNHSEEC